MIKNTASGYGWVHIIIHWLVALTVVGLFILGLWMVGLSYYDPWYHRAPLIHQSIGTLMVGLMVFRLFWRRFAGVPKAVETHKPWERILATLTHSLLYILVISMFFSGYLIATAKGQPFSFFGLGIPATITGFANLEDISAQVHEFIAFGIIIIAGLHGLAAIKHHFIDKDKTLIRILKPIK